MKTSEYATAAEAIIAARDASISEDRVVTVYCDDTTVADVLDSPLDETTGGDHEMREDDVLDLWGPGEDGWRVLMKDMPVR
jgi:hypothetical protein